MTQDIIAVPFKKIIRHKTVFTPTNFLANFIYFVGI